MDVIIYKVGTHWQAGVQNDRLATREQLTAAESSISS